MPIKLVRMIRSPSKRRGRESGNSTVELALVLLPLFALSLSIVDFSLPIFLKSTFTHAVREGCRYGITYNVSFNGTTYSTQTAAIKAAVQANAVGFLAQPAQANLIQVRYYSSVSPYSQVTGANANDGGNILMVSIEGYAWSWIAPLWRSATPLSISAISADRLERLPLGTARPSP